jgi:hypothetical protein
MRQLNRLFGKLNKVSEQQDAEKAKHSEHIQRKLRTASTTLLKTSRKLDLLAGDFGSHESEDTGYQAA